MYCTQIVDQVLFVQEQEWHHTRLISGHISLNIKLTYNIIFKMVSVLCTPFAMSDISQGFFSVHRIVLGFCVESIVW